jgi:hypothetical protein
MLLPVTGPFELISMRARRNLPWDLNKYFFTIASTCSESLFPLIIMNKPYISSLLLIEENDDRIVMLNDNLFILTKRRNFEYVALSIFPCKFFLKVISLRTLRNDLLTFVLKTWRCFSFKVSNLFYTTFYLVYQSIAILWIFKMITLWLWLVPENLISLLSLLDSPRNNWKMIDWLSMKNKSGLIH